MPRFGGIGHLGRELRHDVLGVLADADEETTRALVQPVHADEGEPREAR